MQVFILIKDETDYNGDRTVFGVYSEEGAAQAAADWEVEKAKDWIQSMHENNESVSDWIPRFYIEKVML